MKILIWRWCYYATAPHKDITTGTLKNAKNCGNFRSKKVFISKKILDDSGFREIVEYIPPAGPVVPERIQEFFDWLNSDKAERIHPIIMQAWLIMR